MAVDDIAHIPPSQGADGSNVPDYLKEFIGITIPIKSKKDRMPILYGPIGPNAKGKSSAKTGKGLGRPIGR